MLADITCLRWISYWKHFFSFSFFLFRSRFKPICRFGRFKSYKNETWFLYVKLLHSHTWLPFDSKKLSFPLPLQVLFVSFDVPKCHYHYSDKWHLKAKNVQIQWAPPWIEWLTQIGLSRKIARRNEAERFLIPKTKNKKKKNENRYRKKVGLDLSLPYDRLPLSSPHSSKW